MSKKRILIAEIAVILILAVLNASVFAQPPVTGCCVVFGDDCYSDVEQTECEIDYEGVWKTGDCFNYPECAEYSYGCCVDTCSSAEKAVQCEDNQDKAVESPDCTEYDKSIVHRILNSLLNLKPYSVY